MGQRAEARRLQERPSAEIATQGVSLINGWNHYSMFKISSVGTTVPVSPRSMKNYILQGCGSRSAFIFPPGSWREKIKNNAGKNASKLVINNNCNFIKNFKVNLDQGFLTLEQSLYLFHQQKIFISYFSTKFLKLDPDPHLKSSWIRIRIEKSSWIHFCRMQIHSP